MNIHAQTKMQFTSNAGHLFEFQRTRNSDGIKISQAISMDDFVQVTNLLVKAARRRYGGIYGLSIGPTLSRLNHDGSGPDTGCVLLARRAKRIAGFAVLKVISDNEIEVVWLDAENNGVASCLWDHALIKAAEWGGSDIRVGEHVESPRHLTCRAMAE